MAEDRQLVPLQVADILRDHLLRDVAEENAKMKEDSISSRLQVARDFLGRIELRLGGSGRVVSTSLNTSAFNKKGSCGVPMLTAYIYEDTPLPLSDFLRGRVSMSTSMSGQEIGDNYWVGSSSILVIPDKDGPNRVKKILAVCMNFEGEDHSFVVVEGEVLGLGDGDTILRDKEEGWEDKFAHHLTTHNSVTFTPGWICMLITPELRETIWTFGPIPTFENAQADEALPVDPSDFIEFPPLPSSDKSRLAAVAALGCADSRTELFHENQRLKNERFHLSKVEERLGLVEISHTGGTLRLSLKEGLLSEDEWCISLQREEYHPSFSSVALNDLFSLECFVSGVRLQPVAAGVNENPRTGSKIFLKTFSNCRILGVFDQESIPCFDMYCFGEMMGRTLQGEQVFPPTYKVNLVAVFFTLDSIQDVLNVLGIEI